MILPRETMLGALLQYITREEAIGQAFQPINSNWGILPAWEDRLKDKKERAKRHIARSLTALDAFLEQDSLEKVEALG